MAVCGAHAGGLQALREIADLGYEITVVATALGQKSAGSTMEQFAEKRAIPVVDGREVKKQSFAQVLRSANTDILISVQLPHMICREALEAPAIGSFNLHPSLLPRYAGLHPTSWAIYRGERVHGVTLHWMTADLDAGQIVRQKSVLISDADTPPSLLRNCIRAGMPLITELLEMASVGDPIPRVPQDLSQREYFGKQIPGDGRIDWNRPAHEIANLVRAFNHTPFPLPWGYLKTEALGHSIAVLKAVDTCMAANARPGTLGESNLADGIHIAASDHWLRITEHLTVDG